MASNFFKALTPSDLDAVVSTCARPGRAQRLTTAHLPLPAKREAFPERTRLHRE